MSMATTPKHKPKLSYKAQSFPSSDKPFECTACQLYFRRLHDLKRHERLHTGERPYCCNNCGRTFARLDALKRHLSAESNVHCSEWTYQPGLAMGMSPRGTGKSHQRSLSLPHVHGSTSRMDISGDHEESAEQRTPTTPSPQDHLPFRHFRHTHPQPQQYHQQQQLHQQQYQHQHQPSSSSPASAAAAAGFGNGLFTPHTTAERATVAADKDGDTYMGRRGVSPVLSSPDHHRWRKESLPWVGIHKRSLTQPSVGKLLPSDMMMEDSLAAIERSCTSSGPLSSPIAYPQPQHPYSPRPHTSMSSIGNEPHPQYSLAAFKRVQQPRARRDSHPSLSSRSTLSPSLSPALSPSPSSISPSSMSSPTNVWSYSKGLEHYDTATTPTNNINNAIPDRRAPHQGQQQETRAAHARSESSTLPSFRSSSSMSSSTLYRHDRPAPLNEENHSPQYSQQLYQQARETERHPATSLATILNDQPGPSTPIDRRTPPLPPPSVQQRPAYFSHRPHSQSLSHIHSYSSHHTHQIHPLSHHRNQSQGQNQHYHPNSYHPLSSSTSFPHVHPSSQQPSHDHPDHDPHEGHESNGSHCCDAMVEIQKLRQELDWMTNKYRTLAEKKPEPTSNHPSDNQFSGSSRMIISP